jgi:F-type H+-transporting ATPase subunit c
MDAEAMKLFAAAMCMGIGSIAPAIAEGLVASKAMESIGRNPEIADSLFPKMIVGMAICESTGIYALVISLIILFVA